MLKYILTILVYWDYTLAAGKHNPLVYEVEEYLLDVPREARQYGDKYEPHVFIYNKGSQPDLLKLRYSQQQEADLKNLELIRRRLQSEGRSRNNQVVHANRGHNISESGEISVRRRRIVRPKFNIANQNEFLVDRLIKMQAKYGKKEINRAPHIEMEEDSFHKNSNYHNSRNKTSKNEHVATGDDLEVAGSENEGIRAPADRQDDISAILAKALVSNPQPISLQSAIVDTLDKDLSSTIVSDLSYAQNNQKDNNAFYSLLEKPMAHQIDSTKQLPSSQFPLITTPNSESQISQPAGPYSVVTGIQLAQNNILKSNDQDLEQIQAQLDIISRKKGEIAIAEAQRKALDYVNFQKQAIERAETEARKLAIATINAHNSQLTKSVPQSLPLTQLPLTTEHVQQTLDVLPEEQHLILQSSTSNNEDTKVNGQIPTQTFNLASQITTQEPPKDLGTTLFNKYTWIYPEINYNGGNGVNNIGHNIKIENAPLTKLLAGAYEKSATKTYSQPPGDLQQNHLRSENWSSQRKTAENGYDVKYAPNYAFGYRVMDYHSGIDYGHEESRDGDQTKGKYHVLLPDGRIQNVNYWADPSGYHAKVSYIGVDQH